MKRRFSAILLVVLFATAAYLFAWPSANVPYFGAVILHLLAGIAFLIFLVFVLRGILRGASNTREWAGFWLRLVACWEQCL